MSDTAAILADLARAKAAFQLRALTAIITADSFATGNPSPVADSRGARPSGRTEGHAPAASIRVLVACEYSAVVRDAFRALGFDAWSCDLLPTEGDARWHIQGDALEAVYGQHWDLLIAHPPCTDLAVSGARHFAAKAADGRQARALDFVQRLLDAPVAHIALENPVSIISSRIRKPDFTIQPWQFGHGEVKRTCFWTKNLPALRPTDVVDGREARVHKMPPGPNRWKERSRTFSGVAAAIADQWGNHILNHALHGFSEGGLSAALFDPFHSTASSPEA